MGREGEEGRGKVGGGAGEVKQNFPHFVFKILIFYSKLYNIRIRGTSLVLLKVLISYSYKFISSFKINFYERFNSIFLQIHF